MRHVLRSALLGLTLLSGASFALAPRAEARGGHSHSSFSLSIGVPLGYYGGGYYNRGGFYGAYGYAPAYYGPYYEPRYYGYYAPAAYPRAAYRPYYGPIVTLGLFPAYVGDAMSTEDRNLYLTAYERALAAPIGEPIAWNSRQASGEVTTTRDGWAGQRYCREFRQNVLIDGRSQEAYGTACKTPDGGWQLVQNQHDP